MATSKNYNGHGKDYRVNYPAIRIMSELGYALDDIRACLPPTGTISASELSNRLWDFEEKKAEGCLLLANARYRRQLDAGRLPPTTDPHRRQFEEETANLLIQTKCFACNEKTRNQLNMNCGHIMFCQQCIACMSRCPLCDAVIRETITVYQ